MSKPCPVWLPTRSHRVLVGILSRRGSLPNLWQDDERMTKGGSRSAENETQNHRGKKYNIDYVRRNAQRGLGLEKLQTA